MIYIFLAAVADGEFEVTMKALSFLRRRVEEVEDLDRQEAGQVEEIL
jgi:hypothetical protein